MSFINAVVINVNKGHALNLQELAASTTDNIVLEKFGSKALRIFRVVREKVHVEESQLQSLVNLTSYLILGFTFLISKIRN